MRDRRSEFLGAGLDRGLHEPCHPARQAGRVLQRHALREHRLENGRRWIDKENWELILGYSIPLEEQIVIFEEALGEDVWGVIDAALRKGVPKPSPSSR